MRISDCPLCKCHLEGPVRREGPYRDYIVTCPRCGSFQAHDLFVEDVADKLDLEIRVRLSGVVRRATDAHGHLEERIRIANYQSLAASAAPAQDVAGQVDALLLAIADRARYFGDWTDLEPIEPWVARAYLPSIRSLEALAGALDRDHVLQAHFGSGEAKFYLGMEGWNRVKEARQRGLGASQAFVAMWFHPDMDEIYEQGIVPAIETDCGLTSYRVDHEPSRNRIDAEVIGQIRRSRLVVADVTGARQNVYYEAGFAEGLGIPVIWSSNKDWPSVRLVDEAPRQSQDPKFEVAPWGERLHFDVRQFPHLLWKDAADFRSQLAARIRAWALDRTQPLAG